MDERSINGHASKQLVHVVKKKGNVPVQAGFDEHNTFYYVSDAREHLFGEKNLKEPSKLPLHVIGDTNVDNSAS